MSKLSSARWLNFFLSFTMVTTQILPAGYTQDASQNFSESPDGRSVPVVSLEAIQEDEQAKAEAAQAEKAALEANSYLMSIKESPISKADDVTADELSVMESSSRPAKGAKLHSKAEVEEMAAMIVRSYLGNKSVQFEYEWNHPFMYASEQVVDQDNPTLFTPQQGSLTLSRKLGDGVVETYTLTIGDQGLLFSSAEVKSGDKILSTISWGYDSNGVKTSESKNENLYDADGNQIESRSSWKNMTADGTVTNESTTETYSKYDGKNLVAQTTKSSSRYDNNGTPQTSESSTVLERKYAGEVVIYELITSRGSQNGEETSGSTSLKKVELDAAGHIVYSITESDSWSSYNGTKSEYHYSTIEKSAYNENGDLIEKVTRWENKSTGYSSSSETHLFNTYEGGFLVQSVTKSSSTYNGNQTSSSSTVTNYKRDAAGRAVFEETTYSYNGVENNRSSIERTYLNEKSEKLTSEITKSFYLQGDSLKLNYLQSLKLEYNKEGVLVKTHHQQDSFYGRDNALSYRSTVETAYNTDGKPVSVISKSYYLNENELVLQSSSELKYRYSDKDAEGKTHVTYSSRTEMNADGSVINKETKRYDPRFSMENPSINEHRVMYDIAMPAYSYYMPVYWGWGGGLEKGLLSREMQYFSTDENGDSFLTSTSGDRYWLDGEGKAFKQRNYTKSFNQDGDKTSQITQEYDLIGQQYNYGCCYETMNREMVTNGTAVVQAVGQVSSMGMRADSMMYRPYPYYYNSGRRLTLYDELRYDESGDVIFRKTQRNEYADGLLVSAKLVIKDGDVTRTIKETYAFDALGRASKVIRQVYGPKGQLQLTDERTYEYSGFGYRGYDYYSGRPYVTYGGAAASDKMMSSAIWAPWNAALVKSVRVSLTNHVTGESVKALIAYTNANPGNAAEGEILLIDPYYGSVPYNAADITGTYVNKEGISTPIQGRFKSDGNEHALPTEKLMELLISYAGKNTDPNEKAIQEAIDHFMGLFDFKGLSNEAIAKIRASIQVKSAKQDEWSNGCVGWNTPSTMCTMAFVRGLNITLELFGNEYEIHANRLDPAKTAAIAAINSWLNRGIDLSQIKIESSGLKENEGDAFLNGSLKGGNGEVSEPVFVVILSNTVTLETERFEVAFHGNVIISSRRFDSRGGLIYERFSDGWEADYEYNAGGGGFAGGSEDQFSKPMLWRGLAGIFLRDGTHFVHVSFDVPQNDASKTAGAVKSVLLDLIARGELAKGKYQMDMRSFQESDMGCTADIPASCISSIAAIFTLGGFKFEYRISVITRGNLEAKFSAEQISKSGNIEEVPSPVVTGTFHVPDDSLISTLQRSVYTVSGEAQAWLIDRLPEWRKILDKLDGMKVSFIPGDSFSLEGQEIFTSGILITEDGRAYVLADGKIKQYKDAQFITLSESRCPANPAMGAPCSLTENAMKMPGYEIIHQHEEVLLDGVWVIRRTVALIALPDDGTVSEYKSDEQLLSELHPNSKVLIYEEFDHVATACAPIDGAVCASAKKVFYSYLRENGDRVYQIASINETRVFGGDDVKRTAHVVSEADLERALRAAGFHALQDSGDIFSGIITYSKMNVEKYEELPGDATDDLRSIPYHVVYSVLDCPDGPGLKSCATENYEARVVKSRIQIPEADAYLKYEVSFINETRLIVNYEGGQAYIDWIADEEGSLIRTDVKTGEEVKFFKALDMMSCSYPKDGPAMCAGIAILPGYEQVGSYRKDLPDGGYEERIIMGLRSENLPIEEKGSPVVTGIFQMPDDSMMSTLQRSVYTIEGEKESWLIDRLEELRDTLDTLHGQKVSFIPGKSFSLEGREIFTSGIIITGDGIAFVIEDGKIKSYKDAQFLKVSESRCPANPAMGAPCSIEEMAMKMPGYEEIHRHQEVFVKDGWIVTRTIVLIGIPFEDSDPSEYKTDETLLSELHNGAKIQIYEEFDHAATACAPMLGARCSNTKKVFYSYLLNGDRVYQIAAISEISIYGRNITRRSANVVSEADLERALRAAGFHALQDSGDIFSGVITYNKMNVEKYEALPGDATDDLRSIPYHVIYSVLDCPDGPGLKSCATESYEARVVKSRIQIPEADAYLKYEVSFINETRLIVNYEGGQAYIDWIADEEGSLIRTDVKTGEEVKFVEARDVMSCSYPKDGPALCAGLAIFPGHEQIGSYRRDLSDGGYEERLIFGVRADKNPPVEMPFGAGRLLYYKTMDGGAKGKQRVDIQIPDLSVKGGFRTVKTVEAEKFFFYEDGDGELQYYKIVKSEEYGELREHTVEKLKKNENVYFVHTASVMLYENSDPAIAHPIQLKHWNFDDASGAVQSEEVRRSAADGSRVYIQHFTHENGKVYDGLQYYQVVDGKEKLMGIREWLQEVKMTFDPSSGLLTGFQAKDENGNLITAEITKEHIKIVGLSDDAADQNFVSVERMDAAEADRIRKAVGEGLELLGYEIDDGRPYDGNLVHHYAFRAVSSSLVHLQRTSTFLNPSNPDMSQKRIEDFGLDVWVNNELSYITQPDPRYIAVGHPRVSRIEVAPGEHLMLSVVKEHGGRRTTEQKLTSWTFTPVTQESAFRIKAAINHGLEISQIEKVRMKLTGETAAKCPQGEKCSSYKEYEVLYYADGKEFLADGQIILTTFQGKQFTYYEIQNVREAMSKEEKIRLAIEAAGQDLEALAAQMIIPENQALTEEEFAALDAKLKEIAEKMRALLVALREKIREIEGENASGGIIKMFGGPDAAVRLEQRAGALLSDFYGRLMQADALIIVGGQKIRIPIHKMTGILIGALPNGRWSPAEVYAPIIGYMPEFHPGDGIYLMNVFQNVMLSLAMGPSSRDLRGMVLTFVLESNAKGLIQGDTINLKVFKRLLHGTDAKINLAIKAAGEEIDLMLKGFSVSEVLSEQEIDALLADLDSLYQKIRSRLSELKKQIDELEGVNQDPSEPVLFMQVGGGPDGAVRIERDAEIALGKIYGLIVSRDVRIKTADGSEVVLPLSKMIEVLSAVVGKDQMYSVEAIEKVLGLEVGYDSGRIYFMHVFQFMMASRAAFPDVRTALIEYVRGAEMPFMAQGGQLDLNLFRLSLLGARSKIQEAVAEAYLKAASDAGIFFFKAPEIRLKKMTIISMSKNLPPTEFGLEVSYTADGGGELNASVQLSITADGIKASVSSIKTPFGDSSEEIGRAVIADLSKRTGLSSDNFKVQSVEARNWPDGCLGLPEPGAFCTMAIVPGYRFVIVDVSGKNYVYRTDRTKGRLKLEPEKEAPSMKLAALPADVEAGYKGFNSGRTILSVARGYGKVSEANAEQGMKKFNLISDNRSSATAQGEFVFSSEQGFSLDALTGLSFKGSMKNFMLVFVDAAGKSIQQKVSLKNSQTENIVGIDFSANPDFDAANIRSFRILHSQRERVELTVGYALLPDTKRITDPAPQESFELEGKAFDSSRLTVLPQGVQGDAFGTTVEEGKGLAAYASLLDSIEGKKVTYHFAGSDSAMAGYEVSFGSNADSAAKREIALKGDGKAVELVMVRENGEVITKTVVLPKDFMNYELESGIKQLFIRTSRLMAGHEKGSFMIRFGNQPPAADKLVTYGRNTVPERLRSSISKLRDAHKTWKERYNSRKFSFTKTK